MQTIILFLIYFAITLSLQYWFSIPWSIRTMASDVLDEVDIISKEPVYKAFLEAQNEKDLAEKLQNILTDRVKSATITVNKDR